MGLILRQVPTAAMNGLLSSPNLASFIKNSIYTCNSTDVNLGSSLKGSTMESQLKTGHSG